MLGLTVKMTNLKPCPFCGSTDLIEGDDYGSGYVVCLTCQANGPYDDGLANAARDGWNTRQPALGQHQSGADNITGASSGDL